RETKGLAHQPDILMREKEFGLAVRLASVSSSSFVAALLDIVGPRHACVCETAPGYQHGVVHQSSVGRRPTSLRFSISCTRRDPEAAALFPSRFSPSHRYLGLSVSHANAWLDVRRHRSPPPGRQDSSNVLGTLLG